MQRVEYYVANDGQKFDSEWECAEYEFSKGFENISEMLMLWDGDGDKMKITHRTNLGKAYAIYCSSLTAAKFLKEWGDKDGVATPYDEIDLDTKEVPLGTFIWYLDQWRKSEEIIELLKTMQCQMESGEEKVEMPIL